MVTNLLVLRNYEGIPSVEKLVQCPSKRSSSSAAELPEEVVES
jgi:hypothetical protein